jgi:AcrR family transcriptional regulator
MGNEVSGAERPEARRTRRGEARETQLRARAAALFLERGFDGVSVDEIVRDVGGSKGSVYSFYGGKDGLFLAAMDDTIQALAGPLKRLKLTDLPLDQGLTEFGVALLLLLLEERHLAFQRLVIAEAMRHPEVGLSWYRHGPATTHALLAEFLAARQTCGEVRPGIDPTRLATLFHDAITFDLLNRAMMRIGGAPTRDEIASTVRNAVEMVTVGIRVVPEASST